MNDHLREEQLIELHYGEAPDSAAQEHLGACRECRQQYQKLAAVLALVSEAEETPERGDDYGRALYARLQAKLAGRGAWQRLGEWLAGWSTPARSWATAGALAALLLGAFVTGRWSRENTPDPRHPEQAQNGQIRERVLLVALDEHLERSQMMLVELSNEPPGRTVDISQEKQYAEDLLFDNRLYRQTATGSGEVAMNGLLEELEQVLLEIAHSPSKLSGAEFEAIRKRIEAKGILFKVRVTGSAVRERKRPQPAEPRKDGERL
jgi:hypothetical protein